MNSTKHLKKALKEKCGKNVSSLILKMLKKNPNDRPTAAYVSVKLEKIFEAIELKERKKLHKRLAKLNKNQHNNSVLDMEVHPLKYRFSFILKKTYTFSSLQEASIMFHAQERYKLSRKDKKKNENKILMVY